MDGKTSGNGKTAPFGDGKGKPTDHASGGHDFVKDVKGGGETGTGCDFTKESRPQSMAKAEVVPNPQEIPAGGKDLKADPGPVSQKVAGTASGPQPRKPFRVGK